jgi:decaprenylphospho-beta-D-erythro-pentofuranosid-2-ulose 2-reductase
MIDATGMPQTAVLVGGTSEIGLAILSRLAGVRLEAAVLVGRDGQRLDTAAASLMDAGIRRVATHSCDLRDGGQIKAEAVAAADYLGHIDVVVSATGALGSSDLDELDPELVLSMFDANVGGPAAFLTAYGKCLSAQGSGRIVVLSSVAGLRVRRSNFVYGAGKAGIDGFAIGLREAVADAGVGVMIVRPGFVRTKMTAGHKEAPFACDASTVSAAVVRGLGDSAETVYVPPVLGPVFMALRLLPRSIFRRLPG